MAPWPDRGLGQATRLNGAVGLRDGRLVSTTLYEVPFDAEGARFVEHLSVEAAVKKAGISLNRCGEDSMMGERSSPESSTNMHGGGGAAPNSARLDRKHNVRAHESSVPPFPINRAERAVEGVSRFLGPAAFMLALFALCWWAVS